MNALLFPGQGSQIVGMGSEFYKNFKTVKKIFEKADEELSFSLSKMILEGPANQLQLTKNTQPAILTVSYSIFKVLIEEFNFKLDEFTCFAGHSLGEYTALVCSNSIKFNDALHLLHERGKAMQEAVPVGKGKMIAVLGTEIDNLNNLIKLNKKDGEICEIANDNANGQVILSGKKNSIEAFGNVLKNKKIKFIPLNVSAPFHCSLMSPAAKAMKEKIDRVDFQKPKIEIFSNVTAQPENNPSNIKNLLVKQIFSTVRWRETLLNMFKKGIKNYIEIGPGKVLSGMAKRTLKEANCFSLNSIVDIKNLSDELKK